MFQIKVCGLISYLFEDGVIYIKYLKKKVGYNFYIAVMA